ncbi:MAG: hypothetical protein LUD47_07245 [Clostridia bacterium]|nr:hypothetical protein [Clostridia bacterium]
MSIKKIDQIKKKDKGFKIWDIVIYVLIVLAVVALFLAVFLTRSKDALAGFYVYYKSDIVFDYDFSDFEILECDPAHVIVEEETNTSLTIRFFVDEESPYEDCNVIFVDKEELSVDVIEADCSSHKECYYMDPITDTGSAIICSPHRMNIIPYGYGDSDGRLQTG